ncbi:hypothetical protein Taro_000033 [Colocasia esculenta]|uniref:Uncharacterized protein n=1 Tax=Colocasia esculenta TaxID=4460 RepID=A0A843T6L8_COLES|nr:hypothetical protein [Colocasia esculenta]
MEALEESPSLLRHRHRQRRLCCFSFAAYAKVVVDQLRVAGVPLAEGLSDNEFTEIEGSCGFEFPADLRTILREALPVGAGYPDWRSSSVEELRGLLRSPRSGLLHDVSRGSFWCDAAWGPKPYDLVEAVSVAKGLMDAAPLLVPIYGHFYMPSRPNQAGNPVFFVRGGEVRCSGTDLTDFFLRVEFDGAARGLTPCCDAPLLVPLPAWAVTSPRRIDVWTHLVEGGGSVERPLQKLLKELGCKLREGGWAEREVSDMLTAAEDSRPSDDAILVDRCSVGRHVRVLAEALLLAGWSREDVAYSMGEGAVTGLLWEVVTWRACKASKQDISIE